MRKKCYIIIISLLLFAFILSINNIYASTKTYERTEDDLQIKSKIKVTLFNKSDILKTPKVDETEKVYDFANLFTEDEEDTLYNNIKTFIDSYNMDMVVVTIYDNNKKSAQAYADDFYDYNYFGKNSTCDGILFLIDMENREIYISTTGLAIRVYDDMRIESLLDYSTFFAKNDFYYKAADIFVSNASTFAANGISNSNLDIEINEDGKVVKPIIIYWSVIIFLSIIITVIIVLVFVFKHRTVKHATTAKTYLLKDTFSLTAKLDKFLTTNTTSTYSPQSSGSSFGGGGSSHTHSGGSGISHGGGGRHF